MSLKTPLLVIIIFMSRLPSWAAFQESMWGARPAALGGVFTAFADDANAPAYNPAGISWMTQNELTLTYAKLFTGLDLHAGRETSQLGLGYFSFVPTIKNKRYGSYALSWTNLVATRLYREDSFSLSIADSFQFESLPHQPIFAFGVNLKLLRRSFSPTERTDLDPVFREGHDSAALTGDIGMLVRPQLPSLPGLKAAVVVQNVTEPDIGLSVTDRVPARYSLALAYQDAKLPFVNPAIEVSRRKGRTMISAAWEAWISPDTLAVRVGGSSDEMGGGIGYQFQLFKAIAMRLDYAILWPLNLDESNGSHRISITTAF